MARVLVMLALAEARPPKGFKEWEFGGQVCNHTAGACYEAADEPSPRTRYSSESAADYEAWWMLHDELAKAAARARAPDAVWLGDGLTEAYRGTILGRPRAYLEGVRQMFEAEAPWKEPLVLAIAGDMTQHLLWRLEHGQLPARLRASGAPINLHVGMENLARGFTPDEVARGVSAVTEWLQPHTHSAVLVNELLPRGGSQTASRACHPHCAGQSDLWDATRRANELIATRSIALAVRYPNRVRLADCGPIFLGPVRELMLDHAHPNAIGHALLLKCVKRHLLVLRGQAVHDYGAQRGAVPYLDLALL
jgi:hypothetical protein